MTQPGQLFRQPIGWWPRTRYIGLVKTAYQFSTTIVAIAP